MAFKIELFGSNTSNIKNMFGGTNDYRYYNKDNNTLTTPGYFPGTLGLEVGDRIRVTPSVKTNPDEIYIVTDVTKGVVTVTQVDTDGAVDSVNGKTGNVVLTSEDILPSQTGFSGRILGTDGFVAGWVKPETVQRSAMPVASEEEVDKIYQFTGTTDANYTNGYFYKCVSDGQEPATYSWEAVEVQASSGGLPDQTGQSGKFLTTDGTDTSWSDKPLVNLSTASSSIYAGSMAVGQTPSYSYAVMLGLEAAARDSCVAIGYTAEAWGYGVSVGRQAQANVNNGYCVSIGYRAKTTAVHAIQLGATGSGFTTNSDANTFKVANANGNFEIMDANGYIPAARHATLPASDGTYVLKLVITSGVPTLTWVAE